MDELTDHSDSPPSGQPHPPPGSVPAEPPLSEQPRLISDPPEDRPAETGPPEVDEPEMWVGDEESAVSAEADDREPSEAGAPTHPDRSDVVESPEPTPPATPPRPLPVGKVLALANQKGGVGKTTTAINLGAALVEQGARVLLVDFDPQGALSVGLGLNPNGLDATIYTLLFDRSVPVQEVVHRSKIEGLDLLPSNIDLAAAEIMLVSEVAREQTLKRALEPLRGEYNYILIDCPPSLGLLTINALTAADTVVIPLECEYFALRGVALLVDTIRKVQELLNPQLRIEGILATMLDARTIHGREVLSRVADAFGDKLFTTVIHKTIRFAEAPVAGEPILTYAATSTGAEEYRRLAREVISQ